MIGIVVVVVRQMEMVGRQKYTCEINSVFKKKKKLIKVKNHFLIFNDAINIIINAEPPVNSNIFIVCCSIEYNLALYFCSLAFNCRADTVFEKDNICSCFLSCSPRLSLYNNLIILIESLTGY